MSVEPLYNRIGKGYDDFRAPDPSIVDRLYSLLSPRRDGRYIDIACGTGNYTLALTARGVDLVGLDASQRMLAVAQGKDPNNMWVEAVAQDIPFEDNHFDGAITTLAIHHFPCLEGAFFEAARVLKTGAHYVIYTTDKDQTNGYWLRHYFPKMIEDAVNQLPSVDEVCSALTKCGFGDIITAPWSMPHHPVDHCLYCGKHQPSLYFDRNIRAGISSFADLANQPEVEVGLEKLRADLDSGEFDKVKAKYENDLGDYMFVRATVL